MATYEELYEIATGDGHDIGPLTSKMTAAISIAANAVFVENVNIPEHVSRLEWARKVAAHPQGAARDMLWTLLSLNKASTVAQILDATDAQVQANVDSVVTLFAQPE